GDALTPAGWLQSEPQEAATTRTQEKGMLMDNAKVADAYERPLLSSLSFTQATQMAPDHSPTPCSHQKRSHKAGRAAPSWPDTWPARPGPRWRPPPCPFSCR